MFPNQNDGLEQSVKVKTRTSVLVHPIAKIALLEAACLQVVSAFKGAGMLVE